MTQGEHSRKDIEYHDVIAPQYDNVVVEPRWLGINALFRPVSTHLSARRDRMLDVGTGTGHMLLRYARLFRSVVAIDHSAAMLAIARSSAAKVGLSNIAFIETDAIEYLDAVDTPYDLITCVGFLHHLRPTDLSEVLRRARSRLAPGGRLLISEPIITNASEPRLVRWWNADYIRSPRVYFGNPIDPDEAPLNMQTLQAAISQVGLERVIEGRGWELFSRRTTGRLLQQLGIEALHRLYGSTGPVYWALCSSI